MEPSTGAQVGTSTKRAARVIAPTAVARPVMATPIGMPAATTEPKATSRITRAATRPRNSPPVSGSANANTRSPRISTRSGESASTRSRSCCSAVRSSTESSASAGYWIGTSATRPSADATGSPTSSTCGSVEHVVTEVGQRVRGGRGRPSAVVRCDDQLGGQSGLAGAGPLEQVGGLLGVQPGHLE